MNNIAKKGMLSLALALLGAMPATSAQTDVDLDPEVGGRFSVSLDKKLSRGLHLGLEEEIRFDNNFSSFNRFHTTLGITYKVHPNIKIGVGYALITPYNSDSSTFKSARHRLMVDAKGSVRIGDWRLSLKERLQGTYRSGDMNEYQNPRTALALKSRLKLQYTHRFAPYASIELRNTLNAPVVDAVYNEATGTWGYYNGTTFTEKGDPGWFLDGWDGVYVNRLRGAVGFDYRIDKRSTLDVSLMADYVMDKVVDASGKGKYLKSYTHETGFVAWLTIGYNYSFQ